jgi:hypothetical protein
MSAWLMRFFIEDQASNPQAKLGNDFSFEERSLYLETQVGSFTVPKDASTFHPSVRQ